MTENTLLLPRRASVPAGLSRASAGLWSRLKGLFIACSLLLSGGFAHAVENVYVSPNLVTFLIPPGYSTARDDSYSGALPIGFTFRFGGVDYSQCYMSTNGVLFFGTPMRAWTNIPLANISAEAPSTGQYEQSPATAYGVYALWDDLYWGRQNAPDASASTPIYYTTGAPGSRVFIMQWTNWFSFGEDYEVGTFNVVLHEGSNKIDIYYRNMLGVSPTRKFGISATIGLKTPGNYTTEYSHNKATEPYAAPEGRLLTYTPSAGGTSPYTLTTQDVTPATTAAIETYFLFANTNPKQPVDLSASPGVPGLTSTTLNWDLGAAGVEPTTYTIRYSTSPTMSPVNETAAFGPTGRPYVLNGLTQGATYYWQAVSRVGSLFTTSTISSFTQTQNTVPVANPASYSTAVNTAYSGTLVATDADNTPTSSGLIYSITSHPASGSVSITNSATGAFTYTPAQNASGTITFGFKAFDGTAYSDEAIVTIVVASNTAPTVTLNGASTITLECYVDYFNTDPGATGADTEDGVLTAVRSGSFDRTTVGSYTLTYTVTDSGGLSASVTRTINVVDTLAPVITVPADILIPSIAGAQTDRIFYPHTPTASDIATGNTAVVLNPPTGANFPVGRNAVTITATDPSGNTATATFYVIVLAQQQSPGTRVMDMVAFRGERASGAPTGLIYNINRAFVNNSGDVIYDATLTGAGTNDVAVFYGPLNGAQAALAIKGTSSSAGNFGAFSNLSLNNAGDCGFESLIGANASQFLSPGGDIPQVSATKGGLAPTGGSERFSTLYQPAMTSNGRLFTSATLQLGSGAGVTIANDTVLISSAGTVVAREGSATGINGISYGQLHPRVVASRAAEKYAFSAFLETPVFDPDTNTGLFVGTVNGGPPAMVVREGDAANGVTGGKMFQFLSESVNSAGEVAFRAVITGTGVTAANNDGLWTTAGGVGQPPVLVAREGAIAPVARNNNTAAFSRFTTLHIKDDGSVLFFAFLQNAPGSSVVNTNNDGSIWRWKSGTLTLLAREGDAANNTAGARLLNINGFDANEMGGYVYDATLVPGVGDTTTATNQAVFLNRGNGLDFAPVLVMRRNDAFAVRGTQHTVAGIKISTDFNSGLATGGYGRAINDNGDVVFNLTLSGNKSGIFLLGSSLPPN